jgi:mitochondrial translocator assembly and maintenance protein 41
MSIGSSSVGFYAHLLESVFSSPLKHIKMAFAYGSAVFKQLSSNGSSSTDPAMIDLVLVVNDSLAFHKANLSANGSHYSFLKWFGAGAITRLQQQWGAQCYYNTLIPVRLGSNTMLIKYGIIDERALESDLLNWTHIYMAGRCQKPILEIKSYTSESNAMHQALTANLKSALLAALLIMPQRFTLAELFICIVSLSYSGDFRMLVGEDKNKCRNIVMPQMAKFKELYDCFISDETSKGRLSKTKCGDFERCLHANTLEYQMGSLPRCLLERIISTKFGVYLDAKQRNDDLVREYVTKLTHAPNVADECGRLVSSSVTSIVKRSSATQSLKGLLTAGAAKSVLYSLRKLKKMLAS